MTAVCLVVACAAGRGLQAQAGDSVGLAVTSAQVAATSWLRLVDRGDLGESWDSAAGLVHRGVTRPEWVAAVRTARGRLQPLGARTLLSASYQTELPKSPPGEYVVLQYRSKAGGGYTVVETVTPMREPDGRWRVSGYYIRPQ
jgi:hypothetical protein